MVHYVLFVILKSMKTIQMSKYVQTETMSEMLRGGSYDTCVYYNPSFVKKINKNVRCMLYVCSCLGGRSGRICTEALM